jgi:hypothetical protein
VASEAKSFAAVLSKFREAAGYPSTRSFYRAVGGQAALGCTYTQYLNIEAGRSTPKPALVRKVMSLLELWPSDERGRELVAAYLKALLKDDEFLELALQAFAAGPPSPAPAESPLDRALKTSVQLRQIWVTQEQVGVIEGDRVAYWCFEVLCNDDRDWGTLELSRLLGFDAKAIQGALRKLKRAGLVEAAPDGRSRCYATGDKILTFPRKDMFLPDNIDRARGYLEEMAQRRGRFELYQNLTLRAGAKRLRQYYPHLLQSVSGANIYATPEGEADAGFYAVEVLVRRVFDL